MRLLALELQNFGPYYGHHKIELSVTDNAPVVLVYGENMRGKTTLFSAIRYALYGSAPERAGGEFDVRKFVNWDALDESAEPFPFGVVLTFEDGGHEYEIRRLGTAKQGAFGAAVELDVFLRIDGGNPVAHDLIEQRIGNILHEDISEFFLFDGEMLSEFERMLTDERQAETIRRSIEQILGLPALTRSRDDLKAMREDVGARMTRQAKRERESASLSRLIEQKRDELKSLRESREELREMREKTLKDLEEAQKAVNEVEEIAGDLRERDLALANIEKMEAEKAELLAHFKGMIAKCWWVGAAPFLEEASQEVDRALEQAARHNAERAVLEDRLRTIESSLKEEHCASCGQPLPLELSERAREQKAELEQRLAHWEMSGDYDALTGKRRTIRQFAMQDGIQQRLAEMERTIRRLALEIRDQEAVVERINQRVRGHENVKIGELQAAAEGAKVQDLRVKSKLFEVGRRIQTLEDEINKAQAQLSRMPQADKRLALRVRYLDGLFRVVNLAVESFSRRMSDRVEQEASSIFLELTSEKGFTGLKISPSYYLAILDHQGREIRRRSAGAEQIVALALIGALTKCAVRRGPVVMDTPFGRLDLTHRSNILRWAPTLGTQVILFVQSGEFVRDRDLALLGGKVGRELRIAHAGVNRSRIERVE